VLNNYLWLHALCAPRSRDAVFGERSLPLAPALDWEFNRELSGGRPVDKNEPMISNERPSPYGRRPYQGNSYQPPPRPFVQEDTIKTSELQIERKFITITLKENPRGRFLRITEEAGTKRNTVIIPITGLDDFKRVINQMAEAAEAMPAPKLAPAEEPGDSIGNR
jgi:hypothetical protein